MRRIPTLCLALALAVAARSQNESTVPAACADLPGNAASSMPLRWSQGVLQVQIGASLLPPNFIGKTITGLRMRRPAFLAEPAYPALQRTLTVRAAFDNAPPANMSRDLLANRPANLTTVFGPAPVTVAATPAQGPGTAVAPDLFSITFTTPLQVLAGTLFLEFEAGDAPLVVLSGHWVDSVWFPGGVEDGYVVTLGDGSCTTRTEPTELLWNDPATGPVLGGTASVRVTGAAPNGIGFVWFGLDPQTRASGPSFFGYGGGLSALDPGLAGCHQWAPIDGIIGATISITGSYDVTFPLDQNVVSTGMRIGVQAAWLDLARSSLPVSFSNGLMLVVDDIGVGGDCSSQYFPGGATTVPWTQLVGQMPVLVFEHN